MRKLLCLLMATLLLVGLCFALSSCGECKHPEFAEDYEIVDPTCTTDGKYVYTCLKCNEKVDVAPSADDTTMLKTGHTADNGAVTTAPTCTAAGEKTFKCKVCDAAMPEKTETVAALGHDADEEEYESDGTTHWNVCEREGCGAKVNEEACEMDFMGVDDDYCAKVCFICSYIDEDSMVEHSLDAGEITKTPTCSKQGEKTYTCENCGYELVEDVAVVPHTYDTTKFTTDGTNHWHACSACGAKDETSVAACVYGTPVVVDPEAGSCKPGSSTATCNGCGGQKVTAIPSSETHKLANATYDAANGATSYTCSVCACVYTITSAGQLMDFETSATARPNASPASETYWLTEVIDDTDGNKVVSATAAEVAETVNAYRLNGPFTSLEGYSKFILDFDIKTTEKGIASFQPVSITPKSALSVDGQGQWPGAFMQIKQDGSIVSCGGATLAPAGSVNANKWTHVSIMFDVETGTVTTYLDGVKVIEEVSAKHATLKMLYINIIIPKALTEDEIGCGILLDNMTLASGDTADIVLTMPAD